MPHDVRGDALTKVGLNRVNALAKQGAQLVLEPRGGVGVREVDKTHACNPHVPLPHGAVGPLDEVALGRTLREQGRALGDVGVDPDRHVQIALIVQSIKHPLGVGEHPRIPFEVRPVELPHPEAVEVEHAEWNPAVPHPVDKGVDGRFVVVGGEGGRQPQPE